MTDKSDRKADILAIAREPDAKRRRAALAAVCGAFRSTPRGRAYEVQGFGEALLDMLDGLDVSDRQFLADQLAGAALTPTYLLRRLASDKSASVAAPVLKSSSVLEEDDLLAAARKGGSERLQALAGRKTLNEALEQALIDSGDPAVLNLLLRRADIRNKEALLAASTKAAAQNSRLAQSLAHDLAQTGHMPADQMAGLYFQLEPSARAALIAELAAATTPLPAPDANPAAAAELMNYLRAAKRKGFAAALSRLSSLRPELIDRIIEDPDCDGMAVLCLGLGLGRAAYSSFVTLTQPIGAEDQTVFTARLAKYEQITLTGALALLEAWRGKTGTKPATGKPAAPVRTNGLPPRPARQL